MAPFPDPDDPDTIKTVARAFLDAGIDLEKAVTGLTSCRATIEAKWHGQAGPNALVVTDGLKAAIRNTAVAIKAAADASWDYESALRKYNPEIQGLRDTYTRITNEYQGMDEYAAFPATDDEFLARSAYNAQVRRLQDRYDEIVAFLRQKAGTAAAAIRGLLPTLAARRAHNMPRVDALLPWLGPLALGDGRRPPRYAGVTKTGDQGKEDVRRIQARLRARGWNIGLDGHYGPETERVVRTFQRNKGLPVTGRVDETTWKAIWKKPVVL